MSKINFTRESKGSKALDKKFNDIAKREAREAKKQKPIEYTQHIYKEETPKFPEE